MNAEMVSTFVLITTLQTFCNNFQLRLDFSPLLGYIRWTMRDVTVKRIELSLKNYDWFQETYGVGGLSLSWVLDGLLQKFREAHQVTPAELSKIGALELKRLMEEK